MNTFWQRKKITKAVTGLVLLALASGTSSCRAQQPLPPVDAPLVPAVAGMRFGPEEYTTNPLRKEALPPRSTGTHVTATLRRASGATLVAVWGDPVLWEKKGRQYRPVPNVPILPERLTEVVALREAKGSSQIVIGTRRDGEYVARDGAWKALPQPNLPYNANAQAITAYRGTLFVATLNDGLVLRDGNGIWQHVAPPAISTNAPRQFIVWRDNLYVRHGSGVVDCFNGRTWTRDIFTKPLPRRQVSAMAVRGNTLFLAQWGGWSETTDGITFTHHFPGELRNLPITALLSLGDALYVGTQGRGLAECDSATGAVRQWHDERQGIGDDWITTLAPTPTGGIVAGTFVAGAYVREQNQPWRPLPATQNDCVTASLATPESVFVTLRGGGAVQRTPGSTVIIAAQPEAQSLYADAANHLLWIGTRTGICTVSWNQKP